MKLLKLSSSIRTFKTVKFNESGFTIILAEKNKDNQNRKSSFNGVGKSLIIYLIHFCLGCKSNKYIAKKLAGEFFELDFIVNNKVFRSRRYTSEQKYIYLNNEKFSVRKYNEKLQNLTFPDSNSIRYITFRHLISRFIRPFSYSYTSWNKWIPKEDRNEHLPNLNTLYLFGFDPEIINRKYNLKEKLKDYDKKLKSFRKDPILEDYFKDSDKDVSIDIETLKEKINFKQRKIKKLNFSEDYYEIETKTKELALNLRKINNKIVLYNNAIRSIDESLNFDFGKNSEFVENVYQDFSKYMKEHALKDMKQVLDFHNSLLQNRKKRLNQEKRKIKNEIEKLTEKSKNLSEEHNSYLHLLNKNAPFEQGLAIKDEIHKLNQKLNRLQQYDEIIVKYKEKISNTKLKIEEENKNAESYLNEIKKIRYNINKSFKKLVNSFYKSKESYISIKNNTGNNTIRFNLNVKIDDDSSNGVREVEIFCFDVVLFKLRKNTNVKFLFHDSRLFANVDPSQIVTCFQIIHDYLKRENFQYIISLNENQFNEIKEGFISDKNQSEFNQIFNKRTITLKLGKNDDEKLLGFQVDISYDNP